MSNAETITVPHLGTSTIGYKLGKPYDASLPTLVMVNSFSTSVELYRPQFADEKLTATANLLALEPYGHGQTRASYEQFTYWDSAIANLQVLDALGIAAAFWESYIGNPEGTEVMAMLAPGTGLGGGIVINGRLLRGARGMGAELGHVEIVHRPFTAGSEHQPCGCGQPFCAESYVSVSALQKALPAALAQPEHASHPLLAIENLENLWKRRALEVRPLAARGDQLCLALFDWQAEALGKLCRQVADSIDPDRIVIGGGFVEGGKELTDRILRITRETFKKLAFAKHAKEVRIEKAAADDQAGCLGAALSAWTTLNVNKR